MQSRLKSLEGNITLLLNGWSEAEFRFELLVMNTWPDGQRRAMTQSEHEHWNANNYPGTLQLCCQCDGETGRCEEDEIYIDDGETGPLCEDCYHNSEEYKAQDS